MKNINKKYAKFGTSMAVSAALIVILALPLFNIAPPLGNFFQPWGGVYQHLDDGEIEEKRTFIHGSLSAETTLIRDEFGTPHIFASNIDDMYFAAGFAMAEDRLFEMDILRRFASGRLAELIPSLSLPGEAQPMDPEMIANIDAHFRYTGLDKVGENLVKDCISKGEDSIEYR